MSVILPQSSVKPSMWAIDPGIVACNCARMGLPVSKLAMPVWENAGSIFDTIRNRSAPLTGATWQPGSLYFGGDGDRCILSDTSGVDFTKNFTCIVSFKTTQSANYCYLINKNKLAANYDGWAVAVHQGNISFWSDIKGGWRDGSSVNSGQIRQVAIIQKNTVVDFYIDGKFDLQQTSAECSTNSAHTMSFGAARDGTFAFDGNIYEIILFDQILNANQIQTSYNNPCGMFEPIRSPVIWSPPVGGVAPTGVFYGPLGGSLSGPI